MKLIDKDAALAVIDKRMNQIAIGIIEIPLTGREKADATLECEVLGKVRSLIDSIEMKEVDIRRELEKFIEHANAWIKDNWEVEYNDGDSFNHIYDLEKIARHFFELGLKASNPLTWKDIARIEDITSTMLAECNDKILYDTEEDFCKEVLKRFKTKKGK